MTEKELTTEQKKAVYSPDGEFVVKAGAGTGKTRVLVNKYFHIYSRYVKEGKKPEKICASILTVTFTKKAAKEMLDRLSKEIPEEIIRNAHVSTIDAFCSRFLKENAFSVGLDSDFRVLDDVESRLVFRNIGLEVIENKVDWPVDFEFSRDIFLNESFKIINFLKQQLISPKEFYRLRKENTGLHRIIYLIYRRYDEYLEKENLLDFGKLLFSTYEIIKSNERIRKYLQNKFEYVLVDEYQDTNPAQVKLLRLIALPQNNYFVVGDEQQSIYAFRGAEPQHIIDFYGNISKEKKVVLRHNFRSPEPLPALINEIFKEELRDYHSISSKVKGRAEIELFLGEDRKSEAEFVASRVKYFLEAGYKHNDIVILCRGVKSSREYEEALKSLGISTVTIGGAGFYQQPEIKDILAMLLVIDNPHLENELIRVLRSPSFSVKNSELAELAVLKEKGETLYNALYRTDNQKILDVKGFIENLRRKRNSLTLVEIINEILEETGLILWAVSKTGGRNSRQMSNLRKFIQLARKFESKNIFTSLFDFSVYLKQLEEVEVVEPEARPKAEGVVNIMSVHQAKGLEFPVVVLSNISPKNFPATKKMSLFHFLEGHGLLIRDADKNSGYNRLLKDFLYSRHNQEERRLLYVAMTRSKKHLIITGYKNQQNKISEFMQYFLQNDNEKYILKTNLTKYIKLAEKDKKKSILRKKKKDDNLESKRKEFEQAAKDMGLPKFFRKKEIPDEFSVTQIETYAKCPQLYNFKYRLNIPEPPREILFSPLLFGSSVHRMLYEYYLLNNLNTVEKMKNKLTSLIISYGVDSEHYKEFYSGPADEVINSVTSSGMLKPATEVVYTEKPFIFKVKGSLIKGTIDRVDKFNESFELVDYKTSKKENAEQYELQMGIYVMALNEIFKMDIKKVSIYFVRYNSIKSISVPLHIGLRLTSLINGIRNEIFPANYCKDCNRCPYKFLCN